MEVPPSAHLAGLRSLPVAGGDHRHCATEPYEVPAGLEIVDVGQATPKQATPLLHRLR